MYEEDNVYYRIRDPYTLTCTLENGNLVFDSILILPQEEPYFVEYDPKIQT